MKNISYPILKYTYYWSSIYYQQLYLLSFIISASPTWVVAVAEETTQSQLLVLIRVNYTTLGKPSGMHQPSVMINTTDQGEEAFRLGMMIDTTDMMTDMSEEEVTTMEDNQLRPTWQKVTLLFIVRHSSFQWFNTSFEYFYDLLILIEILVLGGRRPSYDDDF